MPLTIDPEWQQLALYALGAAVLLMLLFRLPYIGRALRALFSLGMLALCLFVLLRHAPFDPNLSRFAAQLGLDSQEVVGDELRVRMSRDGHFWVNARINGVERRMLVDSGATITALSASTVTAAGVTSDASLMPVMLRTANGAVSATTGTVDRIDMSGIVARDLKIVTSPALGDINVLGMNFLSQLDSWRVEGSVLIMTPKRDGGARPA